MKLFFEHRISYYNENQMFYQEGVAVISKKYKYTDSINIRNSLWNTLLSFINYWWYRKFGQNRAIILNFDIIEFVTENTQNYIKTQNWLLSTLLLGIQSRYDSKGLTRASFSATLQVAVIWQYIWVFPAI